MEDAADLHERWVTLAHLLRPQGRKGELLAELLTDFPERFADRKLLFLRGPDGSTTPATVESHWLPVGRNAGRIVLKLQHIDSINAAGPVAGYDLVTAAEQRLPLHTAAGTDPDVDSEDEGAQYIADLLDCTLLDGDRTVGTVHDVHFPTSSTGTRLDDAAPLLVVHSDTGNELLIPFAKAWIDRIEISQKRITMHLPQGLLDINN